MKHRINHSQERWNVPVSVRSAAFTSLFAQHRQCAVETDLGRMGAFSIPEELPGAELLYADLQLPPEFPVPGRLGSGRSGFYKDYYLKGMGRTQLAGNWASRADAIHATGHLFASSAIREYVASVYLECKGLGDTIVPCEGLLLRPLSSEMQHDIARFSEEEGLCLPEVDRRFQAITVKPGNFARWSNVLWLATHSHASPDALINVATALATYARPPIEVGHHGGVNSSAIAEALSAAFHRGLAAFCSYFRAGVYWGSYSNNFSLDGRFLDLELPIFLGGPMCCSFLHHPQPSVRPEDLDDDGVFFGTELFDFVAQWRASLAQLADRIDLLGKRARDATSKQFAEELNRALAATFDAEHLLNAKQALIDRLAALLSEAAFAPIDYRTLAAASYAERLEDGEIYTCQTEPAPFCVAQPEPTSFATPMIPVSRCNEGLPAAAQKECREVNELLTRLDQHSDLERLLSALREVRGVMGRFVNALQAA